MFSIFKKKNIVSDIEWLGVDVHSHLLPGIDDGSPDVAQSIKLINGLQRLGFSKLICTPHIFKELYPNTPDTIFLALEALSNGLKEAKIDVEIGAAAEYMIDEAFLITNNLLCLAERYVLIEMSYLNESPNMEQIIFDLQVNGYKVILAHPERYVFNHRDPIRHKRYKDMGVLFQLNLLSIIGYYGKEVKHTAEYLLKEKMYDIAGTDLHHDKHLDTLTKAVENGSIYEKLGKYAFKNKELFNTIR